MQPTGIYESLITELLTSKLANFGSNYYIENQKLDPAESAQYLSRFLGAVLMSALETLPKSNDRVSQQINLSNAMIKWLADYLKNNDISDNLIDSKGELLTALCSTENPIAADLKSYFKRITPLTGLSQSELFTGSNTGLSLDIELKREILSSDEVWWLVSFIKWTGIRVFADELKEFTKFGNGKKLKIITTSYMGATDQKAVDFLASLPNTEVKLSYNTTQERLHAKSYIFIRNSGFDTGYIGSSNISQSALTKGLEWNLKVTTQEIPHIIDKFKSTFETYWASPEFETYHAGEESSRERLKKSLRLARGGVINEEMQLFFDITPHIYQKQILEKLHAERHLHNRWKNLVVAATGTGKTVVSAFDFRQFYKDNPQSKLLFVAHREEILKQAQKTFRMVLRDASFGELWVGGEKPEHFNQLFTSVQTLKNNIDTLSLSDDFYDFIIIDEVHHIAAKSYRPVLKRFSPNIILGLTATPERHDGSSILTDFCNTIAAELRLPDAINRRHLCPFQYFGIDDPVDLTSLKWERGRYLLSELSNVYMANDQRVLHILRNMQDILDDLQSIKCLAFCVSQDHAKYMAKKFVLKGIKSAVLTSKNGHERVVLREQLVKGEINVLFVVDIFNEGVDIPEIDTILFLRPTESLTVFLQQLGRGLRLSQDKECVTVLDFVGNARPEYDFTSKFRGMVGKSHMPIKTEVELDFPHLPLGCSIVLQKKVKEIILDNIKKAILNQHRLINFIRGYSQHTDQVLTLKNFLTHYPSVNIEDIYKNKIDGGGGWTRLCIKADVASDTVNMNIEKAIYQAISKRLLQSTSNSYLCFLNRLFNNDGEWEQSNEIENQFALMAYYDFWQQSGKNFGFTTLKEGLKKLTRNAQLKDEVLNVIKLLLEKLDIEEIPMKIGIPSALQLHARYSKDAILAALGENNFDKKSSSREGVLEIKRLNIELLFVTLQKTVKKFSPTTLYQDYAINENLFHWQTQNSARPDRGRGLSYIEHQKNRKQIILFVREQSTNEYGLAMGFINLGLVSLVSHSGSQPMNITWRLQNALPTYLWNEAVKLSVG